jgi:excisionase family DNA binding protein
MPEIQAIDPKDILTPAELCKRLKVSRSWPYEKMRPRQTNPLPGFRIGHHLRFNWVEVCAWLATTSNIKPKPARKAA